MKILLSPSESKQNPAEIIKCNERGVCLIDDVMWGGKNARNAHIQSYLSTLQNALDDELCKVFGTKRLSLETLGLCSEILDSPRIQAIELYNGVAYKALDFCSLDSSAQGFLLDSVLITSNLFGLVRASDRLPFYHLNQNYKSSTLSLRKLYQAQQEEIDEFLSTEVDETIVDLRAQVYVKAYPIKLPHYTLNFPSRVSHQAKYHRGLALRELALFYASIVGMSDLAEKLRYYISTNFAYSTSC